MIIQLSSKQSRVIAIVIACLVVVMIFLLFIYPVINKYNDYNDEIIRLNAKLNQYEKMAGRLEDSQRRLKLVKQGDFSSQYYLEKQRPAMASAELQSTLKRVINLAGAQLVSTQVVNAQRKKETGAVTVKVRLKCTVNVLHTVLYDLEMSKPLLFLDNVVVQASTRQRKNTPGRDSIADLLTISFDVRGYSRRQKG